MTEQPGQHPLHDAVDDAANSFNRAQLARVSESTLTTQVIMVEKRIPTRPSKSLKHGNSDSVSATQSSTSAVLAGRTQKS